MQSKFFLKDFLKSEIKRKNSNSVWDNLSEKIAPYKNEIERHIAKLSHCELKERPTLSVKDIYDGYQKIWNEHQTIRGVSSRELKDYFFILFSNPQEGVSTGLYDGPEQFDDFLNVIVEKGRQSYLKRLISELFYNYPKDEEFFGRLEKVFTHLDRKRRSHQSLFKAHIQFRLIGKEGPSHIARAILDPQKELSSDVLSKIWLKERHLLGGIGKAIVKELCNLASEPIEREDKAVLDRFLDYLSNSRAVSAREEISNSDMGPTARFTDPKPIVSVLLRPFENQMPSRSIQNTITQFLDRYVGDPRFKSEKWMAMGKEKEIFLRWKIGETIEDFLSLLSYTANQDPMAQRMWGYRKEFIKAYWEAGHIRKAWIVLGRKDYDNRLKFLKRDFNGYGKIIKGAQSNHSCLLLQIGDLILSEWNYNGKVRIWNENEEDKHSPPFYKGEYSKEDLVSPSQKKFVHRQDKRYSWQKKLSWYIEENTGIECPDVLLRKIYI